MSNRDVRVQNQRSWDAVVPAHVSHHRDVPCFLRQGGSSLFPEELALLGELRGQRLLHMMCNAGLDSLSLANQGAVVTGVDISAVAIAQAREWSLQSGVPATFVQSDIYDWLAQTPERFDRVYASYGAICWLNDLTEWAHGVARVLAPHGRFVLLEFHPFSNMFAADYRLMRDYPQGGRPLTLHGIDDYVAHSDGGLTPTGFEAGVRDFTNPEPCTLFQWGVGEVVTALAHAGLIIESVQEYCFSNGERPFPDMVAESGRRMVTPPHLPRFPLLYGIAAQKGA
jgi:SAM-dependent methyltransferase